MMVFKITFDSKSFTLIEVLVTIFLFSVIFLGIFGGFWLGFKIVGLGERKITATQIAQGEIEKIRNLPYLEVGTIGAKLPFASGTLEASTSTTLNKIQYTIERKIKFIYDPSDGDETCPLDYKRVEIKVSFSGVLNGSVYLTTDLSPKDKVEELKACTLQPAGVLSVQVFNAIGELVSNPKIDVFATTGELIDSVTPTSGRYDFLLTPGEYKVLVSKDGYSKEETYGLSEIPTPEKVNPLILEGQITQISFSIDRVSSILAKTFSTFGQDVFSDSFLNESKISQKENVSVLEGKVVLATTNEEYFPTGTLSSIEISPQNLVKWDQFSFSDEEPSGTDLKYQILFASGTEWLLIPDSDLPGNSQGFDESPILLSNLSTTTYSRLKLKAKFETSVSSTTPTLFDWQLTWLTSIPTQIPNVKFDLRGSKIIGKDGNENPIYKFSTTTQTDSTGQILLQNLEWDVYQFSNFQKDSQPLDLATSSPEHPLSLAPGTSSTIFLYLEAHNSLLITILDSQTSDPIFSATSTLSALNFQKIEYTDQKGQAFFIPLNSQNYNLLVEAQGYQSLSTTVSVSGKTTKVLKLSPIE